MKNKLVKKYRCPCGKMKKIKWEQPEKFESGEHSFTAGHSKCPKCGLLQVHFSGDPNDIQRFIEESRLYDGFEQTDVELDSRSFH